MKTGPFTFAFLILGIAGFLAPCSFAEAPPWLGMSKSLEWKGMVDGEEVSMSIKAGDFEEGLHEIVDKDGENPRIDGFKTCFFRDRNGVMPHHITEWKITWGGKEVTIPKGAYTSIFLPNLEAVAEHFDEMDPGNKMWIGPSEDSGSLMVVMMCGYDAVHVRLALVIAKDGEVRRFFLEVIS